LSLVTPMTIYSAVSYLKLLANISHVHSTACLISLTVIIAFVPLKPEIYI
jgi:hypothetical protein